MSKNCEGCGVDNASSALFCRSCGRPMADDQAVDKLIGKEILGTYTLEELLGKGGMSMVYLGRHSLTEQEVAVKILPPELASQKELKTRFIEEARTLARLEHPNIVVLHNFAEEDGHLYLVMQYAEGETFDTIIAREGRVELAEAVEVVIEVCRALEYAHDRGVIHRDIKPSNVIIRGDGSVKVMDFGLAKFMGSSKLTQTGLTMGTVRYMSPEQVRGKQVDHRTDLYSLGITLYEAVTGRTPFDGETHFEIMQQHLSTAPPAMSLTVEVPDELQQTISKSLAKRVDNRVQTARELRKLLEKVPVEPTARRNLISQALPPINISEARVDAVDELPVRKVRIGPIAVAGLLILISVGAVLWATLDPRGGSLPLSGDAATRPSPPKVQVWPKPHPVASKLQWAVDKRYKKPHSLRVLAQRKLDPELLSKSYGKAREAYPLFLKREGIDLAFEVRPLNLAVVDQEVLNSATYWPDDVKPNTDYPTRYRMPSVTLFVHNARGYMQTDLPYGLALHFCSGIAQLTTQRCLDLAEGFERFFRSVE
jgi:serine/threonine protein kinase